MKISKYFDLRELIPKEIYDKLGDDSTRFINKQIPIVLDFFRDYFAHKIIINDWLYGGEFNYSGFRPSSCKVGAELSSHKLGCAMDLKFDGIKDYKSIIQTIKDNWYSVFKKCGVTAIEEGTEGWLHVSTEWTNKPGLVIIPFWTGK